LRKRERLALVIHGGAKGADWMAEKVSREECICHTLPMHAQWERDGAAGGPIRNAHMVTVAKALRECGWYVTCEAFPGPESRGTRDCMRKMGAAGFVVNNHATPTGAETEPALGAKSDE